MGDFNWLILVAIAVVIVLGAIHVYSAERDALHPFFMIGPLLAYAYVVEPLLLFWNGSLERIFPDLSKLNYVNSINALAVLAFTVGACRGAGRERSFVPMQSDTGTRLRMIQAAAILGTIAVLAYWTTILAAGGFVEAYDQAKGGGRASSGYLGEASNLGLVATLLIGLARKGLGFRKSDIVLLLFVVSPVLLQGTFGGRRGPLFLSLAAMVFAWFVSRRVRVTATQVGLAFGIILLSVVFVWSQRQHLHLGEANKEINMVLFQQHLLSKDAGSGSNYAYGSAYVLVTRETQDFTWGKKIFVNLIVRPIPRQIWPSKYEDVGADWVNATHPGLGQFPAESWMTTVGWIPYAGSAAGSLADLYGEFGIGVLLAFYLLGRLLALVRHRSRTNGGLWDLLYLEAMAVSIYLATQSFSAFYHRFLVMAVPTYLVWRWLIQPPNKEDARGSRRRGERRAAPGH